MENQEVKNGTYSLYGEIMLWAVFIVIALTALVSGNEIDYGVRALMLAYVAGRAYGGWKQKKGGIYLFLAIAACVTSVLALIEVITRMTALMF